MSVISADSISPKFKYHYDKELSSHNYELKTEKLSNDHCYMFVWPMKEEILIMHALEYLTFHPNDKKMNDQFHVSSFSIESDTIILCWFPKEFKDVCKKAAAVFNLKMVVNDGRGYAAFGQEGPLKQIETSLGQSLSNLNPNRHTVSYPSKDALARVVSSPQQVPPVFVKFPAHNNVLWFDGSTLPGEEIYKQCEEIRWVGNCLHKLNIEMT